MSAKDAQATMNYLEERLLQPLLKAKLVIQQAAELEHLLEQREAKLVDLGKELATLARRKQEAQDGIEAMKVNLMQQRNELQALLREDRAERQRGLEAHDKAMQRWRDEERDARTALNLLQAKKLDAEKQLDGLKADLSNRLKTLQGLTS